jgi:hypothetical protein
LALEGSCAPGATDVTKCVVDAQGLAQLTAGTLGVVRVERRDRFGNAVTAGPDMLPFRVEATGVGPVSVETVEAGDGACEVRFEAKVAGRYALHVWSGYKRDAVGGSPFDVNVLPGQAASSSCVAQLEGTKLAGPGVVAAVAGEPLTVRMQARDRFGNATAWKRWQTLSVAASGPQDVVFTEKVESDNVDADVGDRSASGRGVFSAVLHRAGAYVVWCTVGGQAVVGWPRVIQVVPGTAKADASEWRAEAETMALTSEIASNGPGGHSMTKATRIGSAGDAARARAEADSLRASRSTRRPPRWSWKPRRRRVSRSSSTPGLPPTPRRRGSRAGVMTRLSSSVVQAESHPAVGLPRRTTNAPRVASGSASSPRRRRTMIGRRVRPGRGAGDGRSARRARPTPTACDVGIWKSGRRFK